MTTRSAQLEKITQKSRENSNFRIDNHCFPEFFYANFRGMSRAKQSFSKFSQRSGNHARLKTPPRSRSIYPASHMIRLVIWLDLIYLSIYLYLYLSISLSVYLSIYLSTLPRRAPCTIDQIFKLLKFNLNLNI